MDWAAYLKNSSVYKIAKFDNGQPCIHAYGYEWPYCSPLSIELTAYRNNLEGRALFHMKNAHDFIWPNDKKTWNRWTERRFGAHCEGWKIITMAGGANCGKSFDAAKIGLLFWLSSPEEHTVLVASTSLTDLDSRIWGYVKRFHGANASIELPGKLTATPPPKILYNKADTIHGMFAVPLQRGTTQKTASTLIGRHPDRGFLAIIDEGTDVSPGFMEAVPNWEKSPWFQMLVIGNSASMFDPHGLLSRPVNGWDTIDPDIDKEWQTKSGICLYFDCYDSPAIDEPDPEKKALLSKFLFTEKGIEKAKAEYGENSPRFWRFTRGFWPSEDSLQTVLTAVMIDKFKLQDKAHWSGRDKMYLLAGLDPAFNPDGDECILRFATLGIDVNGLWVLDFGGEENIHKLVLDANLPEPSEYQILNQTRELCREHGVAPENLAVDVWGAGSGLGAIFKVNWSEHIYQVSSAGPPSETFVDAQKTQTARDAYDRRVTELWFSMQKFAQAGQIRGLDDITCEQFCTRLFEWKGKKFALETKFDYKQRMGKVDNRYQSPDRADAATMILDLARQFYAFLPGEMEIDAAQRNSLFQKFLSNRIRDGYGPPQQRDDKPSGHPASWGDGFLTSQFDFEENG